MMQYRSRSSRSVGHALSSWLMAGLVAITVGPGCGTKVGNPTKPGEGTEETPKAVAIPQVDFAFTESVLDEGDLELALVGSTDDMLAPLQLTASTVPIRLLATRVDYTVKEINKISKRLTDDQVRFTGSFAKKGPAQNIAGVIQALEGDETFSYAALFCAAGRPFMEIKWREDGNRVEVTHDFRVRPLVGKNERELTTALTWERTDAGATLTIATQGDPWLRSGPSETAILTERVHATRDAAGNLELASVSSWTEGVEDDGAYRADTYLVGRVEPEGRQEYVGYQSGLERCQPSFAEDEPSQPGWCFGGAASKDGRRYTLVELGEALRRLKSIEIQKQATLGNVTLSSSLKCPE